jgi:uncharacterized membrane protein (UPF0127 family)
MLIVNSKFKGKSQIKIDLKMKHAISLKDQTIGLMFEKKKNFNYCLVFHFKQESRHLNSIHMFFVFFSIYTIFLNAEKKVVDLKLLKPFYPLYVPKKDCKYLIEMPIKYKNKIKIGDKISWK